MDRTATSSGRLANPFQPEHPPTPPAEEPITDDASSTASSGSSSSSSSSSSRRDIVEVDEQAEAVVAELNSENEDRVTVSATVVRVLALLCACSLSVGSHYGSYFLGPLKSRLSREIGTSNTEFSLLLAAYNINNTWTPLVGGVMTARLGTAMTSIIATSLILFGQSILLIGDLTGSVRTMVVGLFIFGLGISPLAVVQETIIVRFFCKHGLGVSLALGLVAGKLTSFLSAYTSYPLSQTYGPHAPFVVSTVLAAVSFGFNLIYLFASNWFTRGAGLTPEAADVQRRLEELKGRTRLSGERMTEQEALEKVAAKRKVRLYDLTLLGDVFWLYIAINALCGAIWSPFTHLAANIFEKRYNLNELEASGQASMLLAGSIILYPACGIITDRLKRGPVVHHLFVLSSALTLICYFWLALPPTWTETPTPAILAFSGGHGFSTLLLVIIIPHLVPLQYVSTALGAHKAIESCGSTISKILAGLLLDSKGAKSGSITPEPTSTSIYGTFISSVRSVVRPPIDNGHAIQWLLNAWLFVNVIQLIGTIVLRRADVRRKRRLAMLGEHADTAIPGPLPLSTPSRRGGYLPIRTTSEDEGAPAASAEEVERRHLKDDVEVAGGGNPWLDVIEENPIMETSEEQEQEREGAHGSGHHKAATFPRAGKGGVSGWLSSLGRSAQRPGEHSPPLIPSPIDDAASPRGRAPPSYNTLPRRTLPLKDTRGRSSRRSASFTTVHGIPLAVARTRKERRKGKVFMAMSAGLVLVTWALFFATALAKINGKEK
ncbi:hypothetical protein M407DRAFT_19843 [Tulasnella calospora MUT 4182]|uniref:Lysosomal dipeptide transporter MFSD1 n=1 Tax=Tulasnella calospora MUT 4182 TaxID=1051891 RepID=A0A0C3QRB1_9AGAM|nr:hypothetical protein M407DRAFT_19843 [Tulasnella calospora MUT 4182]